MFGKLSVLKKSDTYCLCPNLLQLQSWRNCTKSFETWQSQFKTACLNFIALEKCLIMEIWGEMGENYQLKKWIQRNLNIVR